MSKWVVFNWKPKSKERPRSPRGGGRSYTPRATVEAEKNLRDQWPADVPPLTEQCAVEIIFGKNKVAVQLVELDARDTRGKGNRDMDNLGKLLVDALNGLAYLDDKQIVDLHLVWDNEKVEGLA